ncbi:MAG TPA: hypothetical protein VIF44_04255, partial [Candidatus Limnocylindrales bacterium]
MSAVLPIYFESGSTRVFAGALDWPGWCRSGKSEAAAVDELLAYRARYTTVLDEAAPPDLSPPLGRLTVDVRERLIGGSGTDFGAPAAPPTADKEAIDDAELARLLAILGACWSELDRQAAAATGVELSSGPRGGGRDLAKILAHVLEAEQAYLAKLGSKPPKGDGSTAHVAAHRAAVRAAFMARAMDRPVPEPNLVRVFWTPRYFIRRAAWHVLDHAWEVEDRTAPDGSGGGACGLADQQRFAGLEQR